MLFRFFIFVIILVLQYSCGKFSFYDQKSEEIICTVGEYNLYESDLVDLYVYSKGGDDSATMRDFYLKRWIDDKVKQTAADRAVAEFDMAPIDRLVDNYRNSLIVYSYEQSYVNNNIDTLVLEDTITAYYKDNLNRFTLYTPIVKAYVARVPVGVRNLDKIEDMFYGKQQEFNDFITICDKNDYKFIDMSDSWYEFSELLEYVPLKLMDFDVFLKENKKFKREDRDYVYLVKIIEYVKSGAATPIEKEIENIKKQVIFNRRDQILRKLNDSLESAALKNNEVIFRAK